jgi:hypothetical protein
MNTQTEIIDVPSPATQPEHPDNSTSGATTLRGFGNGLGDAVPNGTEGLSVKCRQLVEDYRRYANKSAQNTIGMAETVAAAKQEFEKDDKGLNEFCDAVGLDAKGSTFRKLVAIGKKAERFKPLMHKLPPSWTTLYSLAKLSDDEFKIIAKMDDFGRDMTASEIKAAISNASSTTDPVTYEFTVQLAGEPSELKETVEQLHAAIKPLNLEGKPSKRLQKVLNAKGGAS